jgi:DNA-binding transcriptional MerR regulator
MFLSGEFCKIAQVSRRLLRHYKDIGLFEPIRTDPQTGYHYYSAKQLPKLNRILALKELGFSLEQIKRMITTELVADELRGMLALKKAQLEQTLVEELAKLRNIEARLQQIDREGGLGSEEVILKSIAEVKMLAAHVTVPDFDHLYQFIKDTVRGLPRRADPVLKNMILVDYSTYEMSQVDELVLEMGYMVDAHDQSALSFASEQRLFIKTLPAVQTMATITREGFSRLTTCYQALGSWIENNGFRIIGPGREVVVYLDVNRIDDMVVDLQLPVEQIRQPNRLMPRPASL